LEDIGKDELHIVENGGFYNAFLLYFGFEYLKSSEERDKNGKNAFYYF